MPVPFSFVGRFPVLRASAGDQILYLFAFSCSWKIIPEIAKQMLYKLWYICQDFLKATRNEEAR